MDMKQSKLFSPLKVGNLTLRNRLGMAPMSMHYENKDGTVPKRLADIFVRRAEGGMGYINIDAVTVDRNYPYMGPTTCMDSDEFIPSFKEFADRVTAAGSTLIPQVIHPGPESFCGFWGKPPIGPSVNVNLNGHVSREMTIDEIHTVVKQYGQAARRVEAAGCGGIALHCAHAYMMPGAFLSPLRNKRMDEYGGCIDNRARFILEVIAEIRQNVSPEFPIFMRISGDERIPGGNSLKEILYLAPKFEAAGVSALEISGGAQYEHDFHILASHGMPIGMNVFEASEIKKVVNIPVFTVGKVNDIRFAADIVERGLVDGVSLGRLTLADPDIAKKASENRFEDITPCGSCGGKCITRTNDDPHCHCHINPTLGYEYDFPFNPTDKSKKTLIIGAGPGGMFTAVTAAERGHDVTVWEKDSHIGGQLNLAVTSPGKQEMTKWMVHLNYRAKKAGVKFEFGKEASVEAVKEFAPDAVIVATGAKPFIPPIKGTAEYPLITTHDVLRRNLTIPRGNVCILGGGEVACETADVIISNARPAQYIRNPEAPKTDVEVTLIEMQPQVMTGVCGPNRETLLSHLKHSGVKINVNSKILEVTDHAVLIQRKDGTEEWLKGFDYVIFGLGARAYDPISSQLKEIVPEVYVIGDAVKARQSSDAMAEGFKVAYNL